MSGPQVHVYHEEAPHLCERMCAAGLANDLVPLRDPDSFRRALPDVEVLVTESPPPGLWSSAARLRLIQTLGAGVDGLFPAPDLPANVPVCSARGLFAAEVAEHALALLLALQRNLPVLVARQSSREWASFPTGTLAGRTTCVLGLGEVGRRVAAACAALGMRVIGLCRRPRAVPHVDDVLGPEHLQALMSASDHLVVTLPLTPATRGLVDRQALSALRPGALLVHVGRGGVVDEAALLDALYTGHLGGAALDVFEQEPLPAGSPLWTAPNTLVTPHLAGYGLFYIERVTERLRVNLERLPRGEPLLGLTDREAGY